MTHTALITGASSGIGLELAKQCARHNHNIVLVARNTEKLNQLAQELQNQYQVQTKIISKDLSQPTASQEIYDELQKEKIHVDILINNAGFGHYGQFATANLNKNLELIQVNITTLTHLTRLLLPAMIGKREGKILNVASIAGFMPGPLMATYYASKAYVVSFSQALDNELQGTGVSVTCLCPGVTKTDFEKNAGAQYSKLFSGFQMDPSLVASIGFEALMKGRKIVIPSLTNKLLVKLIPLMPRELVLKTVRYVQRPKIKN